LEFGKCIVNHLLTKEAHDEIHRIDGVCVVVDMYYGIPGYASGTVSYYYVWPVRNAD
jgi:hypothetical protein